MNNDIKIETPPKNVNTHAYIQQVQRHKGIRQSVKMVLIHCLTKYQARNADGNPYTFSNAGIRLETGLGDGTIKQTTAELKRHKVLKVCGQMRFNINQDKPTTLHFFSLDALKSYLEVKSKMETPLITNKHNGETTIEASQKQAVKSLVKSLVKSEFDPIEEDNKKKMLEEDKEDKEDSNNDSASAKAIENLKELDNDFYRKSVYPSIVSLPSVSVDKVSTPLALASPATLSTACGSAAASPAKLSMAGSVVRYNPPMSFDPNGHNAYDKKLLDNPPKVIQFKRTKHSRDQEARDKEAIAKASKMFPQSTIELYD